MTTFYVKVTPDAERFTVDTSGAYPRVTVTAPADQGRANTELVSRLSSLLDTPVRIVSGHRSRRKELAADMPEEDVMAALSSFSP